MNDELKDIDLSAWEVPEPPDDLADSVVARLGGTDITPAIPVESPKRNRALLIGGVAAAIVAITIGVWMLIGSTNRAAPTNGVVVAQFAQQLSLDGVTADLDVGANVQWTRDARTMHVQQRSGSAAWRVAADQRLVINAGASTVEANGKSSLRVEVKMNSVERVVGASAFGAAAIAMTVIVYDGKVTVENPKHERVVVAPGTTYTVEPPTEERTVGVAPPQDVTFDKSCDEVSCVLNNYEGDCCLQYKPTPTLTTEQINDTMKALHDQIDACGQSYPAAGRVDVRVKVKDDGSVANVVIANTPDASLGECVSQVISAAHFHPSQEAMTVFTYPLIFPTPVPPPPPTCDGKPEREQGDDAMARGHHAEALRHYEDALKCVADPTYVRLAFVAACNSKNQAKAKQYFGQLTPAQQSKFEAFCMRNGIKVSTCDADALKDQGMEQVNMGEHAKALALFEQSLACKRDTYVVSLAFMAACNTQETAKARTYYGQLNPSQQSKYKVMCDRNNVDLTACDADALKDEGMENINQGKHNEALALFEQSLACKRDPHVVSLAFMTSCNARNGTKAREYWGQLTKAEQTKYRVICDRNKIDVLDTSGDPKGYLQVFSKPSAKILIDGVDTGLTTPIQGAALALAPGKHKVTFVIGGDRFTYFVVTKSGQTDTMTKDLQ